jgi:molecular chaperone HtpG
MNNTKNLESREFQAEVKQLLDIVINSLYTDRQIFLRELISNAADALEKLRYHKLTEENITDKDLPEEISIQTDDNAHTITITDTGIGMTEEELVNNLGTIAHSGSKAFIKHLAEGNNKDVNLIGQFGVGFYSAFMAADKVTLHTRSYHPNSRSR